MLSSGQNTDTNASVTNTETSVPEHLTIYISSDGLKKAKSTINELVIIANQNNRRLKFDNIDQLIEKHHPTQCSHHLHSCKRENNSLYELVSHLKAVQSALSKNVFRSKMKIHYH